MNNVVLKVENLRKSFGDTEVLKGISFELKSSEILGLLGPNGAGKTTILHILMGLTTPASGTISIFGTEITSSRRRAEIQRRMNFSSTYTSLPFSLTAREALTVFARLYGVKNPGKKVREVAGIFGIDSLLDREIRTFSSGQQTRLNLAKAFINDPEILLLDEPTASLDPDVAERTRSFLREVIHSRKMSIIYTSHNMSEMEEMTSRIVFISEGKVVAEGSSNEIVSRFKGKNLEDVFLRIARRETDEH